MRYLVVPSKETESWKDFLVSNEWLERGHSIQIEKENRALPLTTTFPEIIPPELSKFNIIEKEVLDLNPPNYLGFLEREIGEKTFAELKLFWPQSFDQIGENIIVKIEKEVEHFAKEIAQSMLLKNTKATRVFQDLGVRGDFRIRELKPLAGATHLGGETKIKENGMEFFVDPTKGYYSPRLATERLETLECALILQKKLGRKLNVCDAYAGFGPALITLLKEQDLINSILANDLNHEITNTLEKNLMKATKENIPLKIECMDARKLIEIPENRNLYDFLLVNIPHSTLEHLPSLIGLLNNNSKSVLRAWAIIDSTEIENLKIEINEVFDSLEYSISRISVAAARSYSPTQIYAKIEVWIN